MQKEDKTSSLDKKCNNQKYQFVNSRKEKKGNYILGNEIVKLRRPIHWFFEFGRRIPGDVKKSSHGMKMRKRRFSLRKFNGCDSQWPNITARVVRVLQLSLTGDYFLKRIKIKDDKQQQKVFFVTNQNMLFRGTQAVNHIVLFKSIEKKLFFCSFLIKDQTDW